MELLQGKNLNKVMDNFVPICSLNICNIIASIKHCPSHQGNIDNIFFVEGDKLV
jgi:hypothetical protein